MASFRRTSGKNDETTAPRFAGKRASNSMVALQTRFQLNVEESTLGVFGEHIFEQGNW